MFLLLACGPKPVPPDSPLDTAQIHYQRGLGFLETGDAMAASREFERARVLDPGFPGYRVGTALLAMGQGDYWQARQDLAQALHRDGGFVDAHLALARTITAEGLAREYPVEAWYPEALGVFRKAESLSPGDPKVAYYLGLCHFEAGHLEEARTAFLQVMNKGQGSYLPLAQQQFARVQLVERVAPGSSWGLKIARLGQISRAELAVLLVEELRVGDLVAQRRLPSATTFAPGLEAGVPDSLPTPVDIERSWARAWITQVLALRLPGLELGVDRRFEPERAVDREAMAQVVAGMLVLLSGDEDLATRYLGEPSRFPDVRSDAYTYSAIALSAERGIIPPDPISGLFRPAVPVSGAEAMQILRLLQSAVRFEL